MILAFLVIIGLCAGSFVSALVWRLHQREKGIKDKKLSILKGRSMCSACGHELGVKDLVPVVSYLALRGRCRYCGKAIEDKPVVELVAAAVFGFSYLFWPSAMADGQWLLLATWLLASVGLLALAVYDLRWMLLPNRVLYPTFVAALVGRLAYVIFYADHKAHSLVFLLLSWAVASGVFLLLFVVSQGRWIGFGDVRLGMITGTLLATPAKSFLMIFLASILGTLAVIPGLVSGKKNTNSKLPYGPFLIAATLAVVLFGDSILDWYQRVFLP